MPRVGCFAAGDLILESSVLAGLNAEGGHLRTRFEEPASLLGPLTLSNAATFDISLIFSTNAPLAVSRPVTLGGAELLAFLDDASLAGKTLTLIRNTGSGPINGTFVGLPEGTVRHVVSDTDPVVFEYRISYVGGDGNDVTLTVLNIFPPPRFTRIVSLAAGRKQLTAQGIPNELHAIEAATNLLTPENLILWESIGDVTANGTGLLQFIDTNAPALPKRFYRIATPQRHEPSLPPRTTSPAWRWPSCTACSVTRKLTHVASLRRDPLA